MRTPTPTARHTPLHSYLTKRPGASHSTYSPIRRPAIDATLPLPLPMLYEGSSNPMAFARHIAIKFSQNSLPNPSIYLVHT